MLSALWSTGPRQINISAADRAIYNVYGGYNLLHCKNNNNYYNNSNNDNGLFNRSIDGSSQLNYIICHFKLITIFTLKKKLRKLKKYS